MTPSMEPLLTDFSISRVGTELVVRLKWGQTEYKGTLESIDSYMNVLLRDTEEYIDGKHTGSLGLVLIRCVHSSFSLRGTMSLMGALTRKRCGILVY